MTNAIWSTIYRSSPFTAACGLACLAAGTTLARDPRWEYRPHDYTRAARYSLSRSLEQQAMEGRILTSTVWNFHFYEDSEELRSSGRLQLDRLARRFPAGCTEIFVQSAHDIEMPEEGHSAYFARRTELDALRTKSVLEYLQHALPAHPVVVQVHNRPPVGMAGAEALRGYSSMIQQGPRGLLAPGITASRFEFGAGGGGGGALMDFGGGGDSMPAPITMPLDAGSSADFSADVPVGPSGPPSGAGGDPSMPPPPS